MTSDKARKAAVRARAGATGEPYSVAARALADQTTTTPGVTGLDPQLLAPYPDESDVMVDELGWRVLPIDAAPELRARVEATWRPVAAARPCRCSGPCSHGAPCTSQAEAAGGCPGRLIHVDRYPGSPFSETTWEDTYQCDDACGEQFTSVLELPGLPWGDRPETSGALRIYEGTRHPAFEDAGGCPECGAGPDYYSCFCSTDDGCPECGAGGSDDPYGECVCESEAA
ncbi:hypothetical protein Ga0074812_14744 [Parafrankia irregularis]|uniref:Uncharacterized protein n=1 Tax=Parafrankia irregularis TaxID=795642 RepID=A0A0S4R0A1_9ACTN|nr:MULTISPECIES: hypothetical protein [Parafrankia]MBE3206643.1 hypothetical protein [Parafrankia sp. CH37]CUU60798.1 hypothetical protein Ga0074812_14744 [Parafrankia irregularis]